MDDKTEEEVIDASAHTKEVSSEKKSKFGFFMFLGMLLILVGAIFIMRGVIYGDEYKADEAAIKSFLLSLVPDTVMYHDTHSGNYNPSGLGDNDCSALIFNYGSISDTIHNLGSISSNHPVCKLDKGGYTWAVSVTHSGNNSSFCVSNELGFVGNLHLSSKAVGGGEEKAYCEPLPE